MTHGTLRELVTQLWNVERQDSFSDDILLNRVLKDGGHDTEDLTVHIISDLLDEKHHGDWSIVTFAFSELISYYLVTAHAMSFHQVVAASFSACVLADASRANGCDWSLEHDKVMALNAIIALRIELKQLLHLMAYVFGKGGQLPIAD